MEIKILKSSKQVAEETAKIIAKEIKQKPNLVLGLATGKTVEPLYKELVKLYKNKKINFSKVTTFNLDEYLNLPPENKNSYRSFMDKHLFKHINIKKSNTYFPDCEANELKKVCLKYENQIKNAGGIDLQILGVGINGHIAFNEPGSSFNSETRRIKLTQTTRLYNKKYFKSLREVPKYAITMGMKTIMRSRRIILLSTGKHKSKAIERLIKGKVNKKTPASILRRHRNSTIILDQTSAFRI